MIEDAQANGSDAEMRDIARVTGGLPVYSDTDSVLSVTPAAEVIRYEWESKRIGIISEERWRNLALSLAARKHPQLRALEPERPEHAKACPQCDGSGVILDGLTCGVCSSLGWVRA